MNNYSSICSHCGNEIAEELVTFEVSNRGYNSNFDSMNFDIKLCTKCNDELEIESEWFDNNTCFDEVTGAYKNELYILYLIETLIPSVQDSIWGQI